MNTFKKIAAVTMAAATLATTMVSVSAKDVNVGDLISTYDYSKVPTISLSQLDDGAYDGSRLDNINFGNIDWLNEGNAVLNINTTANLATKAGCDSIEEDLDKLRLDFIPRKRQKGCDVKDSDYLPLEVRMGGRNTVRVGVGSNQVFRYFDMTRVRAIGGTPGIGKLMELTIDYKIEGYSACILPDFVVNVGDFKNGFNNSKKITNVKFSDWNWWEDGPVTTGTITLNIPTNMAGKAMDVKINGYKVGTVTFNEVWYNSRSFRGYDVTFKNVF